MGGVFTSCFSKPSRSRSTDYVETSDGGLLGSFGNVSYHKHSPTGELRAVVKLSTKRQKDYLKEELKYDESLLLSLKHQNIVRFYGSFTEQNQLFLAFAMVEGRDLYQGIFLLGNMEGYSIEIAMKFMRQILSAVQYCHGMKVILRNLLPTSFLLKYNRTTVMLLDARAAFTFFKGYYNRRYGVVCKRVHKYIYRAPEVMRGKRCRKSADIWSCGVIFYNLICGRQPFAETPILEENYVFPGDNLVDVPESITKLVKGMLEFNRCNRISAKKALLHSAFDEDQPKNRRSDVVKRLKTLFLTSDEIQANCGPTLREPAQRGPTQHEPTLSSSAPSRISTDTTG